MKYIVNTIWIFAALVFILFPETSFAQIKPGVLSEQVNAAGVETGLEGNTDIRVMIATVIQYFLGVLGTIFLILMVFSAYWLITARGREDYIEKAKKTMIRALVGMTIVLLSYGIATFVKKSVTFISDAEINQLR